MADIVPLKITEIFTKWQTAMKTYCGDNISMSTVQIPASYPAARFYVMGAPKLDGDLEGDEASVTLSVQIDIFAKGQTALSKVHSIDENSHKLMCSMGFYRTFGPEPLDNADNAIKRLTSRYSRLLTAADTFE